MVLDFETTGLYPDTDKIIEVSALKFKDNIKVDEFHTLINPKIKIPKEITKINGITNDMVKNKPTIEEILPKLLDFIGALPIVAHNASFDAKFLKYAVLYCYGNDIINNEFIDTVKIARQIYPNLPNHKLVTIKEYLGFDLESHRAYDDTLVTAQIYINYCNKMRERINELNSIKENLSKKVIYDTIDEDIYRCFIAYKSNEYQGGSYTDFLKIEDKISQICLEHGGRYYKTACKSAKFAIVFNYSSRLHQNIEELKNKGYKVTTFEDALKFFNLEHMWNLEELKNKVDNHKTSLINYYNSQIIIQ
nr:exonuclease domain-containing protein [Caloramator proteoclasticus]